MTTTIIRYLIAGVLASTVGYLAIKNIYGGNPQGISFPKLAATSAAGTIASDFSVDANGGATYNIEIEVPPGTNGVQPNLTLSYSSQQPNGAIGAGWLLNGMPSIQRVGKTIAQDGVKGGVQLNSNDRFALGGQRLIAYRNSQGQILNTPALRNAAYGQNGTEYHTEIESWTRVFSYGNCGGGPCYFLAYSKDGSVTQYGMTNDAKQITTTGNVVIEWAVNKSTDHNGNSVVVNYGSEANNSWYYPVSIYYTSNTNTNLPAQRAVVFNYQARNDAIISYVGGEMVKIDNRLSSIQTFLDQDGDGQNVTNASNLVRQYNLTYGSYSSATNASLLTQIQECDAKGNCLNPTTLTYGRDKNLTSILGSGSYNAGTGMDSKSAGLLSGDFNGDGLSDLMRQNMQGTTQTILLFLANANGSFNQVSYTGSDNLDARSANLFPADYNGDGFTDFMVQNKLGASSVVAVYYSNGSGSFTRQTFNAGVNIDNNSANLIPGDFNGDGLTDFMTQTKTGTTANFFIYYATNSSPLFSVSSLTATTNIDARSAVLIPGDFNGDGKTDFLNQAKLNPTNNIQVYWFDANGVLQNNITSGSTAYPLNYGVANIILGDFNGDGKTDFARQNQTQVSKVIEVYTSDGSGDFVSASITMPDNVDYTNAVLTTCDFNGDGLTDLFNQNKTSATSSYTVYFSQSGTAFNKQSYTASGSIDFRSTGVMLGDFNGDAVTDMITQNNTTPTNNVGIYLSQVSAPNLVTAFLDGLGKYTPVQYAPLTNSSIYKKGSGAVYPYMNVQSSLWVAYHYNVMNSVTNPTSSFAYSLTYQDGQVNQQRGWTGFRVTLLADSQNNAISVTTRTLPFPYSGVVVQQRTVDIVDTTTYLGVSNNAYQSTTLANGAVYSVYNTQYQVLNYTNGTYNFTLTKTFKYDANGMNMIEEDNLGDVNNQNDDMYIGINYNVYSDTSANWWKAFYPVARKVCSAQSGIGNWTTWNAATDLEWMQFGYDQQMNMTARQTFMNTSGGSNPVTNQWLKLGYVYDSYGNVTQNISTDTSAWQTQFDSIYHTFPVLQISPQPGAGATALTTSASFDPRFGVRTATVDPNGNIQFAIPDNGLDGLGSVLMAQTTSPTSSDMVTMNQSSFMPNPEGNGMMLQTYTRSSWTENDTTDWVWNNEYWDALGRHYQTTYKGYEKGVVKHDRVAYDKRGFATNEYVPYFRGNGDVHYSQNGAAVSAPVYFIHEFDRHGRPDKVYAPDPANPGSHYLVRDVEYLLNDSRKVVYTTPHPQNNGQYVKWKVNLNTQGKTLTKSGPYDTLMNALPQTGTTTYTYDKLGNLTSITDPMGQVTTIAYNSVGQEILHTKPESGTTLFQYNSQMKVMWQKDAKGQITLFTYDKLGRVLTQQVYAANNSLFKTTSYTYDLDSVQNGKGQLCVLATPDITRAYQYNNNSLMSEQQVTINALDADKNGSPDTYITRYLYDAMGRLSQVTNPDRSVVQYNTNRYDANLSFITDAGDSVASFNNYTSSNIAGYVQYANEVVSQYAYDFLGRIDSMQTVRRAYVQRAMDYTWNQANKLTNINDIRPAQFKDLVNLSESFVFDNAGRLQTATGPYSYIDSTSSVSNVYQYDLGGNRTKYTQTINGQAPTSYNVGYNPNIKNQISNVSYSSGSSDNYVFDACGNLQSITTGSNTVNYKFSPDGTLASVSQGAASTVFTYDGLGQRISKKANDSTTYYITSLYEAVVTAANCTYTRYIGGPRGAVQAKSQQSSAVTLLNTKDNIGKEFVPPIDFITPDDVHRRTGQVWIIGAALLFVILALAGTFRAFRLRMKEAHKQPVHSFYEWLWVYVFSSIPFLQRHHWISAKWYRPWITALLVSCMLILDIEPARAQYAPGGGYPQSGQTLYFTYDHLGSNIIATDETGEQATTVVYKPYGSIAAEEGSDNFRPKYTGKEVDESTGLYYFGARYYNSDLGRFISPDPAMQYSSPYMYGNDDPTSGIDPNGEFFIMLAVLIVAGIIGAYAGGAIANGTANPLKWDWTSGKTWAGIIGGAAVGVALAAGAVAGLAALGAISAATATIGGVTAGTIAFTAVDVAFLTYDTYQFLQHPNVENGIFVALDLIPFVGALLGRAVKGARAAARGAELVGREGEAATHVEESALREERTMDEVVETCPLSFDGATEVMTNNGLRPIAELQTGDEVWAYNEETGEHKLYPVRMTFKRIAGAMVLLRVGSDTLQATPEHPFFVKGKGWVEAQFIRENDALVKPGRATEKVQWTQTILDERMVYNISVVGAHTFYVSTDSLLSHNVLASCLKAKGKTRPSWRVSTKGILLEEQDDGLGWIVSAVSDETYAASQKIKVGSRLQTIWDIDHIIPYRYLLEAAEEAKTTVTWAMMRNISNDTYNLRLITHAENISHFYEPFGKAAQDEARNILMRHGIKF